MSTIRLLLGCSLRLQPCTLLLNNLYNIVNLERVLYANGQQLTLNTNNWIKRHFKYAMNGIHND